MQDDWRQEIEAVLLELRRKEKVRKAFFKLFATRLNLTLVSLELNAFIYGLNTYEN